MFVQTAVITGKSLVRRAEAVLRDARTVVRIYRGLKGAPLLGYPEVQNILRRGRNVTAALRNLYMSEYRPLTSLFPYLPLLGKAIFEPQETKGNTLTHTFAVIDALENVLFQSARAFNWFKEGEQISVETIAAYKKALQPFRNPIFNERMFLVGLLHDSGNTVTQVGHAQAGAHIAGNVMQELKIPRDMQWEVGWLIENHDWLGPIFFGERLPGLLYKSLGRLPEGIRKEEMLLSLALFTLCDVRGIRKGVYLSNLKAGFYLDFAQGNIQMDSPKDVVDYRLARFTGNPDGLPNLERKEEAEGFIRKLDPQQRELLEKNFGTLQFMDYGFPTFNALSAKNIVKLALILSLAMEIEESRENKIAKISFKWGWPSEELKAGLNSVLDQIEIKDINLQTVRQELLDGNRTGLFAFSIRVDPSEIVFISLST